MTRNVTFQDLAVSEIIPISGGNDGDCWCSNKRPNERTYTAGEYLGEAIDRDACESGCASEGFNWAAYEYIDHNECNGEACSLKLLVVALR